MVLGIGVDTITIERIAKSLEKENFLHKIFSVQERELFALHTGKRKAELAAGCFAGKEAFLKAVGTGLGGFSLAEISVLRKKSGQPYYQFTGKAKEYCEENEVKVLLSLTHEGGVVTAFAILENE